MKKSYLLCVVLMLTIVLFMIVVGLIQNNRMKRTRVNQCVTRTMAVAGCREMNEAQQSEKSKTKEHSEADAQYKVTFSASSDAEEDNVEKNQLNDVGIKVRDATYRILDTSISGDNAEVTVCIYQEEHTYEMTLAYVLVNDEWMLENSKDSIRKLLVDGKECEVENIISFEKTFG